MKKKAGQLEGDEQQKQVEILKAVAQAWHSHSGSSRPMNEFDAHRRNFNGKPSRFKIEAMGKRAAERNGSCGTWDFKQSLWDSYEIVTMSKRCSALNRWLLPKCTIVSLLYSQLINFPSSSNLVLKTFGGI
ncbi:uncharacterized protein LOC107407897 isoform X3 [Ziziphus jujuba]|uniref:Uncharacterized protein LOC107407897 isoform X3 n=1 Tax=Ziziphus jujuba TaxID=326968 RepID=A0ABM4A158_ZIZJJ|nr:uncharacterized protein LOC107407897 isoform X3 [Ziziphus jujuba]